MAFSRSMPNFSMYDANCSAFQFLYALPSSVLTCTALIALGKPPSSSTTPIFSRTDGFEPCPPSTVISPLSGRMRSSTALMVVVFPAPFSPIKPITVPLGRVNPTLRSAKPPYFLQIPCSSSAFSLIILPPQTVSVPTLQTRPQTVRPVSPPAQRPSGAALPCEAALPANVRC